jgi:hypothetical protein
MQKWEYLVIDGYPAKNELNRLGEDGWELVMVAVETHTGYAPTEIRVYFKRPKN